MPCSYDTPSERIAECHAALNQLTQLLCASCAVLEASDHLMGAGEAVAQWWEDHKVAYEARLEKERVQSQETVKEHYGRTRHTAIEVPWVGYPRLLPLLGIKEPVPFVVVYRCTECGMRLRSDQERCGDTPALGVG